MLVFKDPVAGHLCSFLELGNVDSKLDAEGGCFTEGVSGDTMVVAPVLVFDVVSKFASVFHANIDEVNDASCYSVTILSELGVSQRPRNARIAKPVMATLFWLHQLPSAF